MGSVQDGITGVLSNILRPDKDIATSNRRSPTDANNLNALLIPNVASLDSHHSNSEEVVSLRRRSVQQGQALFLQKYGIAELSKLQVLIIMTNLK